LLLSIEPLGPEVSTPGTPSRARSVRLALAERIRAGRGEPHSPESMLRHVLQSLARHYPQADLTIIRRAFDFASWRTRTAARLGRALRDASSGRGPILADIGIDPVAVTAAILHDVPRTRNIQPQRHRGEVRSRGRPARDGVTTLSKFSNHTHEQRQAENIRKMFLRWPRTFASS